MTFGTGFSRAQSVPAIQVRDLPQPVRTRPVNITTVRSISSSSTVSSVDVRPQISDIASLSFSWNMPVNLAVFKREKKLWIVFDHPQTVNIEEIRGTVGSLAKNVFQFPHPQAAIIQMTPQEDVKVFVRKEGLLWIIDSVSYTHLTLPTIA